MTPKEKAKNLIDKFKEREVNGIMEIKQCALICVDEIINSNPTEIQYAGCGITERIPNIEYWNEVKQEIEKL